MPEIPAAWFDMAMEAAEPRLRDYRRQSMTVADVQLLEGSARTRVRRVVAALNGADVEKNAAPASLDGSPVPVLLPRALIDQLKLAMCNAGVYAAMEAAVGADAAASLVGDIGSL